MTAKRCAPYLFAIATLLLACPSVLAQSPTVTKAQGADKPTRGSAAGAPRPSSAMLERSLGWSAGVLAIGAVAVIVSRKVARPAGTIGEASDDRARVMSRVQLTPRQAVHVVRIGQRTLVIGTGPQGSPVALAEWSSDSAVDSNNTDDFAARLSIDSSDPETSLSSSHTNGAAA